MEKEYNIKVLTPMFIGDAGQNPELRASSFKGLIRFWWRASCGIKDLKDMREKEENIFGSTEKKSKLILRIIENNIKKTNLEFNGKKIPVEGKNFSIDILSYLAYGVIVKNKLERKYIAPDSTFTIKIKIPDEYEKEIIRALKCLVTFGGIGSRSRNGFGAMYCKELYDKNLFENVSKFEQLPDFTAFSNKSKIFKFNSHNSWENALSEIGIIYRKARLSLEPKHNFTNRGYIAKPIEVKYEVIPDYIREGRHAKPFFLTINKINNSYYGQILSLPYNFKPVEDETLKNYLKNIEKTNKIFQKEQTNET